MRFGRMTQFCTPTITVRKVRQIFAVRTFYACESCEAYFLSFGLVSVAQCMPASIVRCLSLMYIHRYI
jgi:hypothetical protein